VPTGGCHNPGKAAETGQGSSAEEGTAGELVTHPLVRFPAHLRHPVAGSIHQRKLNGRWKALNRWGMQGNTLLVLPCSAGRTGGRGAGRTGGRGARTFDGSR
jgi:hypothetical protein